MRRKPLLHLRRYKRRLERRVSSLHNTLLAPVEPRHARRDYAWHRSKRNPYDRADDAGREWLSQKTKLWIALGCFACTFGLLLLHPVFRMSAITVTGVERVTHHEVVNTVYSSLAYRKFFFFPADSYALLNLSEVRDVLNEKFPIEHIKVRKSFPNSLSIVLEEKISNVIYDNGKEYAFIDLDGRVVEVLRKVGDDEWIKKIEVTTSTNELGEEIQEEIILEQKHTPDVRGIVAQVGEYPVIFYDEQVSLSVNDETLPPHIIQGAVNWYKEIKKHGDLTFKYATIENKVGDSRIALRQGWEIRVRANGDITAQIERLRNVLNQLNEKQPNQYIDVRYTERAYWQ